MSKPMNQGIGYDSLRNRALNVLKNHKLTKEGYDSRKKGVEGLMLNEKQGEISRED